LWRLLIFLGVLASAYAVSQVLIGQLAPSRLPEVTFATFSTPYQPEETPFSDATGLTYRLSDFKGSYVLVNVWATWCPPCREEMASLDTLAGLLKDKNIRVMPISVDVNGVPAVRAFYEAEKLANLPVYNDPTTDLMTSLQVVGLPTTLLLGPDGKEIGRMIGPAQWDAPDSVARILEATGL
jgi:thiol-disulfide isomerase/thioredoxin